MDTNINEVKYVGAFKRTTAVSIDMVIVMFFRIVIAQFLGALWINKTIENFLIEFNEHFGTDIIKNDPAHLEFIAAHPAFHQLLLLYFIIILVGPLYHAYLNSSAWQGTIGKRLMDIKIVKDDYTKINFGRGIAHYILSILPIIFITYLFALMVNNHLTLFSAVAYTPLTLFLGLSSILWIQIHSFTARKTTAYDLICKVVFIHGKTTAKLPWSK